MFRFKRDHMLRMRKLSMVEQQTAAAYASTHLESMCRLDIDSRPHIQRMTGLICTIGPACRSVETLRKMIHAGMNIARLNFSHGTHEYHSGTIKIIREAASTFQEEVAIALDTRGPEIRTGLIKTGVNEEIEIKTGSRVKITTDDQYQEQVDEENIWVDYKNICEVLEIGKVMYIDDGLIGLIAEDKTEDHIVCRVLHGGLLGSRKGCNLPGTVVDLPTLSEKDIADLKFGVEHKVDMVFASFIRNGDAIDEIREVLGEEGKDIAVVAKIENEEGVHNFDEIMDEADGIMVARGDLGIEIPQEKVFLAQKMMIGRCNKGFKPVICATQMLESMTEKPRPTRAEVSDVANAVIDGSDCVMLSGETAKGKYPLKALIAMHKVCLEAESAIHHKQMFEDLRNMRGLSRETARNVALAAVEAAIKTVSACMLVLTESGRSATLVAGYRPRCPIITVTSNGLTARQLHLFRGIFPVLDTGDQLPVWEQDMDRKIELGLREGWRRRVVTGGCHVVVVTGYLPGEGSTNTVRVINIPEGSQPPTDIHVVRPSTPTLGQTTNGSTDTKEARPATPTLNGSSQK